MFFQNFRRTLRLSPGSGSEYKPYAFLTDPLFLKDTVIVLNLPSLVKAGIPISGPAAVNFSFLKPFFQRSATCALAGRERIMMR